MNFIPAEIYYNVYLIILLILSIYYFSLYSNRNIRSLQTLKYSQKYTGILILSFFVLFIGLRPISEVFADMTSYYGLYNRWSGPFEFTLDTDNKIWDNLNRWLASIQFDPFFYYILIAFIYFGCIYWACCKMFPNDKVAVFLVYLGAFSTFGYGTNGLKAGCAAAIFLVALAYRENLKVCIPLAIISFGFHHSMQLPLAAFFITFFNRNKKYYLYFWLLCLAIAAAHITYFQDFFANLTDEKGAGYLAAEEGGAHVFITGFRPDFILYSAMPVLMGWYAEKKMKCKSLIYDTLLCVYLLTNGIWMLCIYASFTNRIAYLSWCLYPIVLIYPLLKENLGGNQYKLFARVAFLHLGFTLVMQFIYYS